MIGKNTLILLFLFFFSLLNGQNVVDELEEAIDANNTEAIEDFFETWHKYSINREKDFANNDTLEAINALAESILANDSLNRFNFSPTEFNEKQAYYVTQDLLLVVVHNFDWNIEKEIVTFEVVKERRKFSIIKEKKFSLGSLKIEGSLGYYRGLQVLFNQKRWREAEAKLISKFVPKLEGNLKEYRVCHLVDDYRDFSQLIGNSNAVHEYSINSEGRFNMVKPDSIHVERSMLVNQFACFQNGNSPIDIGIRKMAFNKRFDKAIVYRQLECYTGYIPIFYEKINDHWICKEMYWDVE